MLILGDRKFIEAAFDSEEELEGVVVANSEYLFGPSSIYFPKALIRTNDGSGTIPDGFVVDVSARKWFVVEAELAKHSVWGHIAPQVAKQMVAAMNSHSRERLVNLMVGVVRGNATALEKFAEEGIEVIDIRRVLSEILAANPIIGVPIDAISNDLREWAATLRFNVKLWLVRKHVEFGTPERVLYEIPEEFRPTFETDAEVGEEVQQTRYDVTLADLLGKGLLRDGQKLLMNWKPRDGDKQVFEGVIRAGGELEVFGKTFSSPSYAAVYALQVAGSTRKTENGWIKWKTEEGVLIAMLRDEFLRSNEGEGSDA